MFRGRYLDRQAAIAVLGSLQDVETMGRFPWAIVEKVKSIIDAKSCNVLWKDAEQPWFIVKAHYGLSAGQAAFLSTPQGGPLANFFRRGPIPCVSELLVERVKSDEAEGIRREMNFLQATVSLPIFFRGALHAIVNIADREDGRPYNDIDLGHMMELAHRCEHRMETLIAGLAHEQMTAMWAHDLVKPFTLKGSFHFIQEGVEGVFGPISEALKTALSIVLSDAAFVRMHLNRLIHPGNMDVFNIVPNVIRFGYELLREKYTIESIKCGITWKVDVPPKNIRVFCDWMMIEHRVLANLIENAFRYTPKGGEVELGYRVEGNRFITFVRDTGLGIREEELPHVFEARVQGKEGEKGLAGLGLFSAKTVVEGHKGKIWVESQIGKGSTFFVELPVASVGGPE
ncbi:MAG: hypothetical protein IPP35_09470 [Elusimicrobia bacterium]|nr:hypothetical protein [Elusimicrobiota bacterium]